MHTRPAIIAVDIDGTLLTRRGAVLPGTRAEFARATSLGARIMLASGRPVAGLRRLVQRLDLPADGFVYAGSNGSVTVDADTGDVIARHSLPHELVTRICALTAEHGILTMLCDADTLVVEDVEHPQVQIEVRGNGVQARGVPRLTELGEGEAHVDKVLMFGRPEELRAFADVFVEAFGGEVEHAFSAPFYFEATALGIDKGSALAAVARAEGVAESDSVAFGDNGNDIPLLRRAGLGVAMGNAIPATKEAADRVTADNEQEGIALVLAELFGDGEPAPAVEIPEVPAIYDREVDLTSDDAVLAPASVVDAPSDAASDTASEVAATADRADNPHHSPGDETRGRA